MIQEYKNETDVDQFYIAYIVDDIEHVGILSVGCTVACKSTYELDIANNEYELFQCGDNLSFIDHPDVPEEGSLVEAGYWDDSGSLVIARKQHTRTALAPELDTENFITESTCIDIEGVIGEQTYIGMVRTFDDIVYKAVSSFITSETDFDEIVVDLDDPNYVEPLEKWKVL